MVPWHKGLLLQLIKHNSLQTSIGIEENSMKTSLKNFCYNIICKMPSMYQQNAINTYVKYVSIKMLHTCHVMQFVTILCHTIAYQQNITQYDSILCISTKCQKHICQVCINQNAHTCHAMQFIAILCHIIAYQQILQNIVAIL